MFMNKRVRWAQVATAPTLAFWCLALLPGACNKSQPAQPALAVGLVCSDLNKSLFFYQTVIGMQDAGGFEVDGQFSADAGLSNGKPFRVRQLKLHGGAEAQILKLACCSDSATLSQPVYVSGAPGVRYLTFEVASTKAIRERLQQNGIRLLGKTPLPLDDGLELIMVQDPDGVFVEIIGGVQ
jgi:catechol 2,3-dioxygenase-like lactoylglutathione lyase family enzyme